MDNISKGDSISCYIRQEIPNPIYSPTFTTLGITNGTTTTIIADYRDRGAKAIILHSLVISMLSRAAVVITGTDNFNKTIMQFNCDTSMNGNYSLKYIIESGKISLKFINTNKDFLIVAYYQYVYDDSTVSGK